MAPASVAVSSATKPTRSSPSHAAASAELVGLIDEGRLFSKAAEATGRKGLFDDFGHEINDAGSETAVNLSKTEEHIVERMGLRMMHP